MEFWIVGVDHQPNGPIAQVCAATLDRNTLTAEGNWTLGSFQRFTRWDVINWLRSGHAVFTATRHSSASNTWTLGARVILTRDQQYITTEANPHLYDNLGNLPRCTC